MQRWNRSRLFGVLCLCGFIYFLVFTESGSSAADFRANTEAGLARKQQREQELPLRGHLSDEELTKKTYDELQGILNNREKPRPGPGSDQISNDHAVHEDSSSHHKEVESDAPSHKTTAIVRSKPTSHAVEKPKYPIAEDSEKAVKAHAEDNEVENGKNPGKDYARSKLKEYLKHPVVIFSKSYCPHSKNAKRLLLEIYQIEPKPLVIELDRLTEHVPEGATSGPSLGGALQELLADITSRRTVPNIVVGGGHSIGGNDLIWDMHKSGTLIDEIKKFGGPKIQSVDINDKAHEAHQAEHAR